MALPALLLLLFPRPWIIVHSQGLLGPSHEGQSGLGLTSHFHVADSQPLLSFLLVQSHSPFRAGPSLPSQLWVSAAISNSNLLRPPLLLLLDCTSCLRT